MKTGLARAAGFTLIEMAMVLVIMGLLLGGGLSVLRTQIEQQRIRETQKILDDAKEALLGFAAINGRLPCPATAASAGVEAYTGAVGASACTSPFGGFLPVATLGLPGGVNGVLLDGWQTPNNSIRYAVSTAVAGGSAATTTNGIQLVPMTAYAADLQVCNTATGITNAGLATAACPVAAASRLTTTAVAIIYSRGANASSGIAPGADESANSMTPATTDRVFVFRTPTEVGAPNGAFDDMVTWIPQPILISRMIQAGRLP